MLRTNISSEASASSSSTSMNSKRNVGMAAADCSIDQHDDDHDVHEVYATSSGNVQMGGYVGRLEPRSMLEVPQLVAPSWVSPRMKHFMAAGSAAALSSSLYNPLDCLRVRWQVLPHHAQDETLYEFGKEIIRREGLVQGLWKPGVGANAAGMAMSAAVRFGYYESVRDYIASCDGHATTTVGEPEKKYWHMVVTGLICGTAGYALSTPFHLLKTRIQAEHGLVDPRTSRYVTGARIGQEPYVTHFFSGALRIMREEGGVRSLFRGTLPLSSRGAFFTAGQMVGYDGLKTLARRNGYEDGTPLHVCSSISASFFASLLSNPSDLVMAKYMSCSHRSSVWDCVREVHRTSGLFGFWRGWPLFFMRLSPVMLTYSTVYEQMRHQMGLGYFR